MTKGYEILALDIGKKRIGVARAHSQARLVEALRVIVVNQGKEISDLRQLLETYCPQLIVVGLPLDKKANIGKQASWVQSFAASLLKQAGFSKKIAYQDETLSSQEAIVRKADKRQIDAVAATVILEDYLQETA